MTHQKYSVKFLLNKGISYCKMVAKELGVTPEGDKRQVITWADAIVAHQANLQPEKVEKQQIVIEFNDGMDSCDLAGYSVADLDGNIIRDGFRSYATAERWAAERFEIVEQQSIAQQEIVDLLESQIQEAEKVVIHEIDFGYAEVRRGQDVVSTISHNFENGNWEVQFSDKCESFLTYAEAEAFAINYIDERGSGRVIPISQDIENINYDIEDQRITDLLGERYTVRFKGYLAGTIWLDTNKGWTLGSDYYPEPLMAAKALALLTRKELVA
jgi:hypothetical protein